MSWKLDTSGLLACDGNVVTLQGQVKGDAKANAMWMEQESACWRFEIKSGGGMWVGVALEEKFGAGYGMKGLLYGGPGNLSDGGSLVTGGWGPQLQAGDTVDMMVTQSGDNLKMGFSHNNSYLGTAFNIDGWTGGAPRPVVSLSSTSDSVSISNIGSDSFTRNTVPVPSDKLTGSWVTNDYSLSLSEAGAHMFRMSIGIKAGNNKSGRIKRAEDGTWSLMEPMMSTMMLPSPETQGELKNENK